VHLEQLTIVAFGLLVVACVFYVGTSYAFALARSTRFGLPRARLLRAAAKELFTTLVLLPLWPFWLMMGSSYEAGIEGEGRKGRHPVVLLHGLAMNRTNWVWLGRRLARRGLGPLYGTTYFSPQRVSRSARHLRGFIERVCAREDAPKVDIVAHSLGGVVARYYVERLGGDERVHRLVTIATPHRGTEMARLGLVPSAREMRAGSDFLVELGLPEAALKVRYTSIWSRADAIVVPAEAASIAPAGEDCVFDDLGHLSLLLSPRVAQVVAERLAA
jgi:triacylglycerol esterase/lipase EstA (alpha/beta hydrolase family)